MRFKNLLVLFISATASLCSVNVTQAADWSKPSLLDSVSNYRSYFDARLNDTALALDPANTTATNIPTNSIRWNSASAKWQKYNGTSWVDMASTYAISISGNAATASTASAAPWSGITGKPTTVGGFGITDAITTAGGQSINGNLTLNGGDLWAYRSGGTTGVLYLNNAGTRYLYFDGTNYVLNGASLTINGATAATLASPAFTGTPTAPTAASGTSTTQIATTAFVNPASNIASSGYRKEPDGLIIQWGEYYKGDTNGHQEFSITFPIAFSTACFGVFPTIRSYSGTASQVYSMIAGVMSSSTTGATLFTDEWSSTTQNAYVTWFAIGK